MGGSNDNSDARPFARPFGGIPIEDDFVPSLLFALGFAIAFGINLHTSRRKNSKTFAKLASLSVASERIVATSFRMAQSLRVDVRESWGMVEYSQVTLSVGFITLMQEQFYLALCAATSATRDGLTHREWREAIKKDPSIKESRQAERDSIRKWVSRMELFAGFTQLFQMNMAVQASITAYNRDAPWILYCRFLGNMMALLLAAGLLSTIHQVRKMDGINKVALQRMNLSLILILLIPTSRCLLSFETSTTLSTSPMDAGNIISKIVFYLFQLLPELAVCLITATTDYKTLCDTGKWGDYPRARVEKGLPPKPAWFAQVGLFFKPWKWPCLLANCIIRMQRRRTERVSHAQRSQDCGYKPEISSYEVGEKLLLSASSVGWKSCGNSKGLEDEICCSSGYGMENQSTRTARSIPSGNLSGSGSSQASSCGTIRTESFLIADVNLWTPRLPAVFSFGLDSRPST